MSPARARASVASVIGNQSFRTNPSGGCNTSSASDSSLNLGRSRLSSGRSTRTATEEANDGTVRHSDGGRSLSTRSRKVTVNSPRRSRTQIRSACSRNAPRMALVPAWRGSRSSASGKCHLRPLDAAVPVVGTSHLQPSSVLEPIGAHSGTQEATLGNLGPNRYTDCGGCPKPSGSRCGREDHQGDHALRFPAMSASCG